MHISFSFLSSFSSTRLLHFTFVHYIEVFCDGGTKKSVQCSELGGVHYIEVCLQQKIVGGTGACVHMGGVHYIEVFTKGGYTVVERQRTKILELSQSHTGRQQTRTLRHSVSS